LPGENLFLS